MRAKQRGRFRSPGPGAPDLGPDLNGLGIQERGHAVAHRVTHRRGPNRIYGEHRIDLAERAGHPGGWSTGTCIVYGKPVEKRYKTFVATWRPAGGAIRVVLVDEPTGWVAFFCTDPQARVAEILGLVADRFALETCFRDHKQAVGAGQQRVRGVASNVGCFHLCPWPTSTEHTEVYDSLALNPNDPSRTHHTPYRAGIAEG